jgi:tetratricopeptide (TPR) repeat protein
MDERERDWERRVAAVWKNANSVAPEELVRAIDELAGERPDDDAAALFERASARDTAGLESDAEKFYRAALASERLDSYRRARATIQLASTLRILGQLEESERLLVTELDRSDANLPLRDEVRAFLALTYVAQGRGVEAAAHALIALAPYLSRYNRAVKGNAEELLEARGSTWAGQG